MNRRTTPNYAILSLFIDLCLTLASWQIARLIVNERTGEFEIPLTVFAATLVIWAIFFFVLSVYDMRRNIRAIDELQSVGTAIVVSGLVLAGWLYFTTDFFPRTMLLAFLGANLVILGGWRLIARLYFRAFERGLSIRRVVVIGAGELGQQVAQMIKANRWMGLDLIGFIDDEAEGTFDGVPTLGRLAEVRQILKNRDVDEVVIALPDSSMEKIDKIVARLQALPVQLRIVPSYLSLALYRATAQDFGGLLLINLSDPALTLYQRTVKRAFDIMVSASVLLLASPIMALVAIAIRLDSSGPIVFRQRRVGENGRLFTMYKFRSMYIDAEQRLKDVLQYDEDGNVIHKFKDDPRVTRIGKFIRKTSLDELPQLLNVIKGDMSLVGPRPELPWLVEEYEPWQAKRLVVPQGITGWWQINGRSDKLMHLHTEDDLYYVQNYSLLLDLIILWKTVPALLKRRGAY